MSARFNEALQGAFGHVRGVLRRCEIATKNETTNIAYGILDDLHAMPLPDRLALARALVPGMAVVPRELVQDLADDLAAHIDAQYQGATHYPSMERKRLRDMEPVERARTFLAAAQELDHG